MASRSVPITNEEINLDTALGLEQGQAYVFQNTGSFPIYIRVNREEGKDGRFVILPAQYFRATPDGTEAIWATSPIESTIQSELTANEAD